MNKTKLFFYESWEEKENSKMCDIHQRALGPQSQQWPQYKLIMVSVYYCKSVQNNISPYANLPIAT